MTEYTAAGRACRVCAQERPQTLLLQPVDDQDLRGLAEEWDLLQAAAPGPFLLAAAPVRDWFQDLSPWRAPAAFGKQAFGDGAGDTLRFLLDALLPAIERDFSPAPGAPWVLGGYSLAGLFALWCGYETDAFRGVAAASPSVWFPGWLDYARPRAPKARRVCLSLGDREEKARNPVLASVGGCIRAQHALLQRAPGVEAALQWNPGNHFMDAPRRTARAFAWAAWGKEMDPAPSI